MAPAGSSSTNLDDDQRFALMKLRRNVKDLCTKPAHNDYFLLRWLRARSWNPEAAEKMLRESFGWREKWAVETFIMTSWQPPEILLEFFPSGVSGFDKEGSPVIILPFADLDVWGLLHCVRKAEIIRLVTRVLEGHLQLARNQSEKYGEKALKLVVIMDMEGFSMRQYAWRPAGEMVITLLQLYEMNYPEILKTCYIINAPKVFSLAFAVVKKFVHEYTINKIKIFKADRPKWESVILQSIDKDQLPKHYGGTMVDEDGNPRCPSKIRPGGKIPKSRYAKDINQEKKAQYTNIVVKKGEKYTLDLLCADQGCFMKWEFGLEDHDIKFSILCLDNEGVETVVHGPRKISGKTLETGVIGVNGPATYTAVFDNTSSFLRNKKIYYDIQISTPIGDISLNALDDDVSNGVH